MRKGHSHQVFVDDQLSSRHRLICLVGGSNSTVLAFHKDTGTELWRVLTAVEIGYAASLSKLDEGLHTIRCVPLWKEGYLYGVCARRELLVDLMEWLL